MPRLASYPWKRLHCVLLKLGFVYSRQESSHRIYHKKGVARAVCLPEYKSVGVPIVQNIINAAGITRDDFFKILDDC